MTFHQPTAEHSDSESCTLMLQGKLLAQESLNYIHNLSSNILAFQGNVLADRLLKRAIGRGLFCWPRHFPGILYLWQPLLGTCTFQAVQFILSILRSTMICNRNFILACTVAKFYDQLLGLLRSPITKVFRLVAQKSPAHILTKSVYMHVQILATSQYWTTNLKISKIIHLHRIEQSNWPHCFWYSGKRLPTSTNEASSMPDIRTCKPSLYCIGKWFGSCIYVLKL